MTTDIRPCELKPLLSPLHHCTGKADQAPGFCQCRECVCVVVWLCVCVQVRPEQNEGLWPPLLPVAREDLLLHLDGDVTLLPPLVEIQQVGSEA